MEHTTERPKTPAPANYRQLVPHEIRVAAGKKSAAKNLASDPDFYKKIGQRGGSAPHVARGFQLMTPDKLAEAGRKGGLKSRKRGRER